MSWDRDHLLDLFSEFGPVTLRRMFSGYGISADGVNFAMALRGGLIFRVDEITLPKFDAEGAKPFEYKTAKKTVVVQSYRHVPERLHDDAEEFASWAWDALAAARRARPAGKKRASTASRSNAIKKKAAPKKAARRKR